MHIYKITRHSFLTFIRNPAAVGLVSITSEITHLFVADVWMRWVLTLKGTETCFCFIAVYQLHAAQRSVSLCDHTGAVRFVEVPPVAYCREVAVPGLFIHNKDHDGGDAKQHDDEENQGHRSPVRSWRSERRRHIDADALYNGEFLKNVKSSNNLLWIVFKICNLTVTAAVLENELIHLHHRFKHATLLWFKMKTFCKFYRRRLCIHEHATAEVQASARATHWQVLCRRRGYCSWCSSLCSRSRSWTPGRHNQGEAESGPSLRNLTRYHPSTQQLYLQIYQ